MSSILTRLDGSENLKANIGYKGVEVIQNDFDTKYPWNRMEEIEDSAGNKWIRIYPFYTQYDIQDGVIKGRRISEYKVADDWFLNPIFVGSDGTPTYVDVAKYLMGDYNGIANSKSGFAPIKGLQPSVARARANSLSDDEYNVYLYDIWTHQMIQDLFTIEFATTDCQQIMSGYKYDYYQSASLVNGTTDAVPYVSGTLTERGAQEGLECMKYRGIENLWGNGSMFVDGIRGRQNVFVSTNPMKHGDNDAYEETTLQRPEEAGVIYQLGFDANKKVVFPITINAKGAYKDQYDKLANTATLSACYCGSNSSTGIWTYSMSAPYNSALPQSIFRLVRKHK